MKKRAVSIFTAAVMAAMLIPVSAFAETGDAEEGHNHPEDYCPICDTGEETYSEDVYYDEEAESVVSINGTGYPSLEAAVSAASNSDTIELLTDITLESSITIEKELTISGYATISRGFYGDSMFDVENGGCLNLSGVTLNGCSESYSGYSLVTVLSGGELTLNNEASLRNSAAGYGAAVYIENGGVMRMYSGSISGCTADNSGGGIYNDGTLYISGDSSVTGNKAYWGGGIRTAGTVYLDGGASIINNQDYNDGADNLHIESDDLLVLDSDFYGSAGINANGDGSNLEGQKIGSAEYAVNGANNIVSDWDSSYYGLEQEDNTIVLTSGEESESYNVTFDAQAEGVIAPEGQYIASGETAMDPGSIERDGFTFNGWYTEAECYNLYDFNAPVTTDLTLYASWSQSTQYWTVDFSSQHGTYLPESQIIEDGQTVIKPEDPAEEGYIFDGWYTEEECIYEYDFDAPVTANLTLYASWEEAPTDPEVYTVNFHTDYGTAPDSQQVTSGQTAVKPEDPSEAGYSFEGWFTDNSFEYEYDFDTPVTANIDLVALWYAVPAETYTVSFYTERGTAPDAQMIESGQTVVKPSDPTAKGYDFAGWYTDSSYNNAYDFNAPVTASFTLYAKWVEKQTETETETQTQTQTYVVTFYTAHGTAPQAQTIEKGNMVTKPQDPTASGYIFGGWYTEEECKNQYNFNTPVTDYMILYAKWTEEPTIPVTYSVTFYTAHGTTPAGQLIEKGQTVTKPVDPSEKGYIFGGWYTDIQYKNAYDFNSPVTASMTLYAKWTEEPTTTQYFTVSFYTERGTVPSAQTVEKGLTVTKPSDPTASGYVFGGWYTEKDCKNAYDFNKAVTSNMTLFAKWTELPDQSYVVSFNSNGHGHTPDPQTVKTGELVTKPSDPTAVGYVFNGWYTDSSCTQAFNFKSSVTADITLYAGWSAIRYTVKFDSNGGVGTMASQSFVYNTKANLTANTFSRSGYYFAGWNTKADGSGDAYADTAEVINLTTVSGGNVDLYAQWKSIYNVIEGIGGKVQKGGSNVLVFFTDGDYSKFTGITVNKNTVATAHYQSWSGNNGTYVQLNADYINSMSAGTYTIRFMYTDGSCETTFEVVSSTPKTGDTSNTLIWIIIAIACLIVIAVVILIILGRRRRYNNRNYDEQDYDDREDDDYDNRWDE